MPKIVSLLLFVVLAPVLHAYPDSISTHSIMEVEITGTKKTSTVKATTPTQTLDSDELNRIGVQSVSDAVRRFSGVVVKDYGGVGGMKTVSLRGMGAQHTAVSYDGITISNAQSGIIDIGRFSLDNISEISLVIGQSDNIFQTARSFASSGTLSIETAAPYFDKNPYKGNVQIKTGSFGYFSPSVYYAHKINPEFSVSANVNWERTDGKYPYELKNVDNNYTGKRKNSDVDILRSEVNLYGNMDKGGTLRLKINYFESERGIPGQVILYNDFYKDRQKDKDLIVQAHYKNELSSKFSVQGNTKFNRAYYNFLDAVNDNRDKITQYEYYLSGGMIYTPLRKLSISLTEDVAHNRLSDNFTDSKEAKRTTSLTLLASQYKGDYLTVTGSLLATYMSEEVKSGNPVADKKKISPFIGFTYRPLKATDLQIRAFHKKIFRVPTFDDLYYTRWIDKSLKPENTKQYNVGITWVGQVNNIIDFVSISVDGYCNKVENKILPVFNGSRFSMRNMGDTKGRGLDVNIKTQINVNKDIAFDIWGTYGYQKVRNMNKEHEKSYKHQLPHTPKHFGSFAISCNNPWINISYTGIISGVRYFMDENLPDYELESYSDHSISFNKTLNLKNNKLGLQFNLLNIGDKNYQIIRNYPMPGRSFSFLANFNF